MKTVYINLDAYLAPLVAWIKGGKSGDAPKFDPLPLAVSVGAGESVGVFAQSGTVSGAVASVSWEFSPSLGDAVASDVSLGLSEILASETASVYAVSGDAFTATATITDVSSPTAGTYAIAFRVIVNRAKASGPVDLVDFTPPATLTAAQINTALGGSGAAEGQPLKGVSLANATNAPAPTAADIKSTLVAAGNTALDGVSLGGAILRCNGDEGATFENPTKFAVADNSDTFNLEFGGSVTGSLGSTLSS